MNVGLGTPRAELLEIAKKLNIKVHPNSKDETIVYKINQQPVAYKESAMMHPAEKSKDPTITNTPEEVLEAIKSCTDKPEFKAEFPGDGTWIFSYKGVNESGNLSIPLRIIKRKAESVARGRRGPSMMKSPYDGSVIFSA